MKSTRQFLATALSLCLVLTTSGALKAADDSGYQVEVLTVAGKVRSLPRGLSTSESVIKVRNQDGTVAAGVPVTFLLREPSQGSPTFTNNGAVYTVKTDNFGVATTGPITSLTKSSYKIVAAVGPEGQVTSTNIPVTMQDLGKAEGAGSGFSHSKLAMILIGGGGAAALGILAGSGAFKGSGGSTGSGAGALGGAGTPGSVVLINGVRQ